MTPSNTPKKRSDPTAPRHPKHGSVTRAIYHRPRRNHIVEVIECPDDPYGECIYNPHDHEFIVALRNAWPQIQAALSATGPTLAEAARTCQIVLDDVSYGRDRPWREGAIYAAERCLKRIRDLYVGDRT